MHVLCSSFQRSDITVNWPDKFKGTNIISLELDVILIYKRVMSILNFQYFQYL